MNTRSAGLPANAVDRCAGSATQVMWVADGSAAVTAWVSASRVVARCSWISTLRTATVGFGRVFLVVVVATGGEYWVLPGRSRRDRMGWASTDMAPGQR